MGKDDDEIPNVASKKRAKPTPKSSRGPSAQMLRLMRITKAVGILLGGFVTLVGLMSLVGLVTDNLFARLLVALAVAIALPAFVSDRLLKRTGTDGSLSVVADAFAIVLLGVALTIVAAEGLTRPLLTREGDRYARAGSTGMASVVYFLAGVSPVYPGDKAAPGAASASASPSASAGRK